MSFNYCEHCTAGFTLPGQPKGEMRDRAYFVAGSDSVATSKAIILLTDLFGLPLVNCKIMADQFAESVGCDVWVPDQFGGWPIAKVGEMDDKVPQRPGEKMPLLKTLGLIGFLITRIPRLFYSRPSAVDQRIHPFIRKLKEDKKYTKIGAVGYCFGGATSIRLAATDLVDSVVVAHPGGFKASQIAAMKVPTSWQCAEEDSNFGPKIRNDVEALFAARKDKPEFIEYEFHDYKGTVHGFAIRPNLSIPESKEAFEKSFEDTVQWFKKTL